MTGKNLMRFDNLFYYDWDFTEPPPNDFICTACNNVLKSPRLTSCCSKRFCTWCFRSTNSENEYKELLRCPECDIESVHSVIDKESWESILDLDVKCPFSHRGCWWTGELRARSTHLTTDCQHVNTECTYGCTEELTKDELEEHLKFLCPKRPVTCQYCNEEGEKQLIHGDHKNECSEFPIQCPNSCEIEHLKRKELTEHLSECPEETVECSYSYAGCTEHTKRKCMAMHLLESAQDHLNSQTKFFLLELDKKDKQLQKLASDTDQQLLEMQNTHKQKLKEIVASSKEQHDTVCQELKEKAYQLELSYKKVEVNTSMTVHSQWGIQRELMELTKRLFSIGDGMTEIWEGTYNDSPVIVKKLQAGVEPESFLQEAHTLMKLEHENIIKLHGVVVENEPVCIVLEQMHYGNLKNYLAACVDTLLLHQQIHICKQVAQGLDYLQQKLCVHRNIKAWSILLGEKFNCKLGDFKLAKWMSQCQDEFIATEDERIPVRWSAPEVIQKRTFSLKSDVWSYGVLMYEVATCGCIPYSNQTNLEAIDRISSGHCMHQPSSCPENYYSLMLDCWKQDPWSRTRPTFEALMDLLEHVKDSHDYATV